MDSKYIRYDYYGTNVTKICSIEKDKNTWELFDCNDKRIILSTQTRFSSLMNRKYRKKRKNDNEAASCVWILTGTENISAGMVEKQYDKLIQVGRTKNLTNLLSNDIKEDIKEFYSGEGKYGELKENYSKLTFYEIDVKGFIKNDKNSKEILGEEPKDKNLKLAYLVNCAAYIEGKLSAQYEAELYYPSTLDGYYYEYFKSMQKTDSLIS